MSYKSYTSVLLTLHNCFLIFPHLHVEKYCCKVILKILSWGLLVITVLMGPLSIWIKDNVFDNVHPVHRVVYDISTVVMYITNMSISLTGIFKKKQLSKLFDDVLFDISSGYEFVAHFAAFVVVHAINIALILYTQLQRTDAKSYQISVLFGDGFLTFRLVSGLFTIFLVVKHIGNKMEKFNRKLQQPNGELRIREFRVFHNALCDRIQEINSLFGVLLLLIIFYIITIFLRHAVFISIFYNSRLTAVVRCLWMLIFGGQAAYLAHIGQNIVKESEQTVAICYRQGSKTSNHKSHNSTNQEFFLLAQQALNRTTKISAAGFFSIDNSMILFMATTFFTYFIVVMQLLH